MQTILSNWNIWRILRLILGIIVIYEAGKDNSFALYMLGGFLFFHALLNIQCGASGCNIREKEDADKDIPVIKTRKLEL
jgi:uncharacterized membrane protein HdeD (DUF308 family)